MVKTTAQAKVDVITKSKKVKSSSLKDDSKQKKKKSSKSEKQVKPKVASIGDENGTKKKRKAHRFKPGTVANMEIKRFQTGAKAEESLLPRAPVYRIIKDILAGLGDYRIEDKAVTTICGLLQQHTTMLMKEANQMATHAKRKTINIDDMNAARKVCEIHTGKVEDTTTSSRPDFPSFPDLPRQYKSSKAAAAAAADATENDESKEEEEEDASKSSTVEKGPEIEIPNNVAEADEENDSESS